MRVIITGANGFIGSALVRKFAENGHTVVAIVKNSKEDIENINKYASIIYSDLTNTENLTNELISDEETIFYHLAWMGVNGIEKGSYSIQIKNIEMACKCAELAKSLNCKRFLISGTVAENAISSIPSLKKVSPGLMYAVSKYATRMFIEVVCKGLNLPFVWMQFSNIFGLHNKTGNLISYTLSQILNNKEAQFGPANQPYDFIYIGDLINAIYKIGIKDELSEDFYFIGSGRPRILKEYLTEIGELTDKVSKLNFGAREDDGVKYNFDMFKVDKLYKEIGQDCFTDFPDAIKEILKEHEN